jgi:hypothetical protein
MEIFHGFGTDPTLHLNPERNPSNAESGVDVGSPRLVQAVQHFTSFSWWSRVWTIQEMVLSKTCSFYCGRRTLDGSLVLQAAVGHNEHGRCCAYAGSDVIRMSISDMEDALHAPLTVKFLQAAVDKGRNSLLLAIDIMRDWQATDARDKIYGVLALAADATSNLRLQPNYHITVEDLYINVTLAMIQHSSGLEIFTYVLPQPCSLAVPSWVPDWTIVQDNRAKALGWSTRKGLYAMYDANGKKPADCTTGKNRAHLKVAGSIVDVVKQVNPKSLLKGYRKVWPVLRALETWSDTGVIDSINHGPGRITLAHTLGGSFIGSDRIVTFKNSIILDRWWAWVTSTLHPTASSVSQVVDQFDRSVTLTSLARVFMLSESGRMLDSGECDTWRCHRCPDRWSCSVRVKASEERVQIVGQRSCPRDHGWRGYDGRY